MAPQPQRHPTTPQTPTSYPMTNSTSPYFTTPPPSPIPSPPIHRDPPNIKNTLLMSDPLYRPGGSQTAHLFRNGILHPYPALEDEDEDEDDEEENWIDDSTPEKDADGRQQKMALPAHGRARMREARRSGSPPARFVGHDIRQREDHCQHTGQELKERSEVCTKEHSATESRGSRGALKNGGGGRACGGYESDRGDDLGGESTGYWDRREERVRGVRGRGKKRQGAPENGRSVY
ncbi:hypothetical protein XANCAGTX0491_007870 [Xanthoria calcicola]